MPKSPIHDLIKESFPKSNKADWLEKASGELGGKDPIEELEWTTNDSLHFLPYYDAQDLSDTEYLQGYQLQPANDDYGGTRAWKQLRKISVSDAGMANRLALNYLSGGIEGLLFDVSSLDTVDVGVLFDGIDWRYCSVSVLANSHLKLTDDLVHYIRQKKYNETALQGALYWKDLPEYENLTPLPLSASSGFHVLGMFIPPSTVTGELADALLRATKIMDLFTNKGFDAAMILRHISFSFVSGQDFFLSIAKFRAIRILWHQFALAFGVHDYLHEQLPVHALSEKWCVGNLEPHSNMLKSTTASLAAVLGGCNLLTIESEDDNNPMLSRIADNTSAILREESFINKVSDPLAGAYAIDNLVDKIAGAAWKSFQQKVAAL